MESGSRRLSRACSTRAGKFLEFPDPCSLPFLGILESMWMAAADRDPGRGQHDFLPELQAHLPHQGARSVREAFRQRKGCVAWIPVRRGGGGGRS